MPEKKAPATIEEYIAGCEEEIRPRLQRIRQLIHEAAPEAVEKISWAMPTFYLHGNLVHFAAGKHHVGLYPGASGVEHFLPRLDGYKTSKGAIQLPNSQPLPEQLIQDITAFRVEENTRWHREKQAAKEKKQADGKAEKK